MFRENVPSALKETLTALVVTLVSAMENASPLLTVVVVPMKSAFGSARHSELTVFRKLNTSAENHSFASNCFRKVCGLVRAMSKVPSW